MTMFDHVLVKTAELHKLATDHITWLTEIAADGQSECFGPTLWILVQTSPANGFERGLEIVVVAMPFNTAEEKRAAMTAIARRYSDQKSMPLAVIFSCEAWSSRNLPKGMEPKDDPFRGEGVIVVGMTAETEMCMATAPITRINRRIQPLEFGPLKTEGISFRPLADFYAAYAMAFQHRFSGARN